jgi:hypothetical protein
MNGKSKYPAHNIGNCCSTSVKTIILKKDLFRNDFKEVLNLTGFENLSGLTEEKINF